MKSEDLLMALNELEADLVLDAEKTPNRVFRKRRLTTLLIAAVLVGSLAITAVASADGAVWFQNFFSQNSGMDLSNGQIAYIGENTTAVQQSQTMNGYTITLESALSDGVKTLIQFKVTAPEDVVLGLDIYTPGNWADNTFIVNEGGKTYFTSGGWDTFDEDKTDNAVTILYESDNFWYEKEIDQLFGHTWNIRLVGLDGKNRMTIENMNDPPPKQHITDGLWEFEVTFPESGNKTVEFISEPVSCPAEVNIGIQGYHYEDVDITSLRVRAMSVALTFQHPTEEAINADFDDIYAVMKDGSQALLNPYYSSPNFLTFDFDAPIVVDEIDHILLPNGAKLPTPAE